MNKTILVGTVEEVNAGGTGEKAYTRLKAITVHYVPNQGERKNYHTVIGFNRTAEALANLKKGTPIAVEADYRAGRPYLKKTAEVSDSVRKTIDELIRNGQLVSSVDLIVINWEKLAAPNAEPEDTPDTDEQDDTPVAPPPPRRPPRSAPADDDDQIDPFADKKH